MAKDMQCCLCHNTNITHVYKQYDHLLPSQYKCPRCGPVYLTQACADDFPLEGFTDRQRAIVGIVLRNEYERRGKRPSREARTLDDLRRIMNQYRDKDPLEKMDQALINLEMATKYVGQEIRVPLADDFLYYHCFSGAELSKILQFIAEQEYISVVDKYNPQNGLWISPKGYLRLRELRRSKDSRQCFVAMWLSPEMNKVYEDSIQPAIEYIEEGEAEPRFRALRIDNKEHTNDINDEIISEIRRSRFMVCDLTGYRGGVYFEAGFAYGLGLEVIYTCREDWLNKQFKKIKDTEGKTLEIVQEGIHFDLEHRNRISWTEDDLSDFRKKLTNCIKAVIVEV